jgi:hypothetical protein
MKPRVGPRLREEPTMSIPTIAQNGPSTTPSLTRGRRMAWRRSLRRALRYHLHHYGPQHLAQVVLPALVAEATTGSRTWLPRMVEQEVVHFLLHQDD